MPFVVYDTQELVPEAQRDVYEQRDGKWHPKIPDVTKLNSAIEAERTRAAEEEKLRKKAEKDLADLRRAEKAKGANISDEELQNLRDEDAKARKPIEEERDRLKAENRKLKLTDRVKALALSSGVMPDRIAKVMKDLESRVDLTDGGDTVVVKDAAGKVTTETIEDFLRTTYKAEAPFFYAGADASGSGAEKNGGGQGGSYDPVAAGKAAATAQKVGREQNALAFK